MTIEDIADTFFLMPETQEKYPEGTTDEAFVTAIYQNVFNRDNVKKPDEYGAEILRLHSGLFLGA